MKTLRGAFVLALGLATAACGGSAPNVVDGIDCYPAAARPWIAEAPAGLVASRDPGGRYAVYVDGSASMAGYLTAGRAGERPLPDLIGMLPQLPGVSASGTELVRFDRKVSVVDSAAFRRLQTPAGYACPAGRADCDAQESHVDQALARIAAADRGVLSVVVSDLWLTNSEVLTSGGVALSKPLTDILASGRAVAVYGFESPYAGRVYDLPSGSPSARASGRYLFVVAVGAPERLDAFHAAMMRAPSAVVARDLASGRARHSLFTTEPVAHAASGTQAFEAGGGALTRTTFLPVLKGVRVPQFQLERAAGLRESSGAGAVPWRGVDAAEMRAGAVWLGPSRGETSLFRRVKKGCVLDGAGWRAEGSARGGWRGTAFSLVPSELATMPRGDYLLVGDLRRTGLESPNPATAWMREWGFEASGEAAALKRPFVPTLNLGETARLMEDALARAAEARPIRLGGFAAAVRID